MSSVYFWRLGDCLARSRLTAIPSFASMTNRHFAKTLQPQLTRARTLAGLRPASSRHTGVYLGHLNCN